MVHRDVHKDHPDERDQIEKKDDQGADILRCQGGLGMYREYEAQHRDETDRDDIELFPIGNPSPVQDWQKSCTSSMNSVRNFLLTTKTWPMYFSTVLFTGISGFPSV
jgi:hypothetical protein